MPFLSVIKYQFSLHWAPKVCVCEYVMYKSISESFQALTKFLCSKRLAFCIAPLTFQFLKKERKKFLMRKSIDPNFFIYSSISFFLNLEKFSFKVLKNANLVDVIKISSFPIETFFSESEEQDFLFSKEVGWREQKQTQNLTFLLFFQRKIATPHVKSWNHRRVKNACSFLSELQFSANEWPQSQGGRKDGFNKEKCERENIEENLVDLGIFLEEDF